MNWLHELTYGVAAILVAVVFLFFVYLFAFVLGCVYEIKAGDRLQQRDSKDL